MKIENKKIDKLIPYEFNNKEHNEVQINRIANSIKEFGFTQPIVIDNNNIVIIGHGRLAAAQKLGLSEVPTVMMGELSEVQVKKLRIIDNKLNESEWNLENLKLELDILEDMNMGEIEITKEEMFPEFDAPTFNPDEYTDSLGGNKDDGIIIKVIAKDEGEAELIRNDLKELGYKFK